ncbi:hypothetical protein L6164_022637 [Bauhinia variegata]|uniref:Uncharacterized protein n=1 Tax=Bauhinia variegata TaxID=167791 RepID=A0ACB9MFR1_BAUVA|nr:hypothetical protein L6164_022637 [Bauhinia variegata]
MEANNNGSSCNRTPKKLKQKKAPQRGLGVARLERIRIEEQWMKDYPAAAAMFPSPNFVSPSLSPYVPLPSDHPSSSSNPFPSWSPPYFRSPFLSNTFPLANHGGFEANWPGFPVPLQGNVPNLWNNYESHFKNESSVMGTVGSCMSSPYGSNLPNWMQSTQEYQHPSPPMVNALSESSSTPPLYYSRELPSNQSDSRGRSPMPTEEKRIGMKRSYTTLDVPPASPFNSNLPTSASPMETYETASYGLGGGFIFSAGNSTLREVPSSSASNSEPNSKNFYGDFLSLAPPTPTSMFKPSSTFLGFHDREYPDFESSSYQENIENEILPAEFGRLNQQLPFYNFFPEEPMAEIDQAAPRMEKCDGEVKEVDLSLKLSTCF